MATRVFPSYNPRVLGLGIGRQYSLYRLEDQRGGFHFVHAASAASAQRQLDTLDLTIRAEYDPWADDDHGYSD